MKHKNPNPQRRELQRLFNKQSKSKASVSKMIFDTIKDLRHKKEMGLFITAVIIPGGLFAYAGYRAKKYFDKRAANDNKSQKPDIKNNPQKPSLGNNGFRL